MKGREGSSCREGGRGSHRQAPRGVGGLVKTEWNTLSVTADRQPRFLIQG
jgi:hypothetical protein